MPNPPTTEMGRLHELHTAEILGGHKTGSSGNQWDDQLDGAHAHDEPFAFRWDGKSTKGQSITVTAAMLAKIIEQAQGERPALPLRWYGNEKLTEVLHDWIAVRDVDLSEMREAACAFVELQAAIGGDLTAERVIRLLADAGEQEAKITWLRGEAESVRAEAEELRRQNLALTARLDQADGAAEELKEDGVAGLAGQLKAVRAQLAEAEYQRDHYKEMAEGAQQGRLIPPHIPRLPWTVVYRMRLPAGFVNTGMHYDAGGAMTLFEISTIRVERSAHDRPRLMVNDRLVSDGDLYVDGMLTVRACRENPYMEKG